MKAHDVRSLRICALCGVPGHKDGMLSRVDQQTGGPAYHHGNCILVQFGLDGVKAFPLEQVSRLTLDEIGPYAMAQLVKWVEEQDLLAVKAEFERRKK